MGWHASRRSRIFATPLGTGQFQRSKQMMGDKMPGQNADAPVEVTKTGEKKTISGYSCMQYRVKQKGKELLSVWTTQDVKGFESMGKEMKEFGSRLAALNPMNGKAMAEGMKKIEGFPIQTEFGGFTNTVTKIEQRTTPVSEFEVPAGYKKEKSKMTDEGKNQ